MKYKNEIMAFMLKTLFPTAAIVLAVIASIGTFSCRAPEEGVEILQGDFTVPEIREFSVIDDKTVKIEFSKQAYIDSGMLTEKENSTTTDCTCQSDMQTATVTFSDSTITGKKYLYEGIAKDDFGNTLSFSIEFEGYNSNPAKVILSEIRNAYGTKKIDGVNIHKIEFAELYVIKEGNLSGLEIASAADGDAKKYSLPAIDVSKGEYITVHMRTIDSDTEDGQGMTDELEDDLSLSTHLDHNENARDLWAENTKAVFADSDIVFIRNSFSGEIEDAVMFAKSSCTSWKDDFTGIIEKIRESGVWQDGYGPQEVLCSDLITSSAVTRSMSRQNVELAAKEYSEGKMMTNNASVWKITQDKGKAGSKNYVQGVTPGEKNLIVE